MRIVIADKISKNAVTQKAGATLYAQIHGPLANREDVTLDFTGVSIYSSPFFNNSVGRLFRDIDEQVVKEHLHIENINTTGEGVLRRVIENAIEYYSMTPEEREERDRLRRQLVDGTDEE